MLVYAAVDSGSVLNVVWVIVQVVIGLSAVIFVHELGHFAVAKFCGVRCDKFYLGFDVPLKLGPFRLPSTFWKRKWGETEYGIGILPLGGYVKMLGQDDNPAKIAEEMQRAAEEAEGEAETKQITGPDGETYSVHPRSYLAKSVPQRMAIISAGVVMNMVFAFVFAVIAFGIGVPYMPCIVSETVPGSPAWEANVGVGDEILELGTKTNPSFTDLTGGVMLGDLEQGVTMVIRKPGTSKSDVQKITLRPRQGKGLARIGVVTPRSLRLARGAPVDPFTPAARAKLVSGGPMENAGFQGGDEVVAVDGRPVSDWRELSKILVTHPHKPLDFTVRRGGQEQKENPYAPRSGGQELTFSVDPRPMKRLGLVMDVGPIAAVQADSPAAERGVQPGDSIESMNGEPIGDPVTWPDRVTRLAEDNEWVTLQVRRQSEAGESKTKTIDNIMPRVPSCIESAVGRDSPMSCAALGIAYHVVNHVGRVVPGSPAEEAGIRSGDFITAAEFEIGDDDERGIDFERIEFGDDERNWPVFMEMLQALSPQSKVRLAVKRGEALREVLLRPAVLKPAENQPVVYYPFRGFSFEPLRRIRRADSLSGQIRMGWEKTVDSLLLVYRFLSKIGGQVPIRALGGPITIAKASYYSAFEGPGKLLVFLTILSANLAVINFLPIPVLDGGHMVFLAYEGIRGRPPKERFVVALHMIGFVFIISLMVFVFALDLGFIPRDL